MPTYIDFSIRKLDSVLRKIEAVKATDFPHEGGEQALDLLTSLFQEDADRLKQLPDTADEAMKTAAAAHVNYHVVKFLPIIGFILRSTNVRNSFEFFGPVLELSKKLLGEKTNLILSSEWRYSPLTYALVFEELPNFVFVGLPVFESGNALVIPLAGHELGHSVWRNEGLQNAIRTELLGLILEKYRKDWSQVQDAFAGPHKPEDLETDLFLSQIWSESFQYAIRQCQEVFCDMMAIAIFGTSYLHAFEYLLAPQTGGRRSPDYPEIRKRAEIMVSVSTQLGRFSSTSRLKVMNTMWDR